MLSRLGKIHLNVQWRSIFPWYHVFRPIHNTSYNRSNILGGTVPDPDQVYGDPVW